MPELPEVESTVRRIRPALLSQKIVDLNLLWHRTLATHKASELLGLISGNHITDVSRRGKYIIFHLSSGRYLLVHLRMSGHLEVRESVELIEPHDRLVITLANNQILAFHDPRKFGKFYLVDDPNEILFKLGPEPTDGKITGDFLYEKLRGKKTRIKALLLNQSWISGLGNIYADEVLWRAKIHPLKRACKVTKNQAQLLAESARNVIVEAITLGGTDFGDGVVPDGKFIPEAYGKEDEPCSRCGTSIRRIVIAQRSSYYCKKCQN